MLITKYYAIGHEYAYASYSGGVTRWVPTKTMHIFCYVAGPYRENRKLHTYHKRKHVWSMCEDGRKTLCCAKRSRQIEKFCKQVGAKRELTVTK